jgi:hypothetical protein
MDTDLWLYLVANGKDMVDNYHHVQHDHVQHSSGLLMDSVVHFPGLLMNVVVHSPGLLMNVVVHFPGLLMNIVVHSPGLLMNIVVHSPGLLMNIVVHSPGQLMNGVVRSAKIKTQIMLSAQQLKYILINVNECKNSLYRNKNNEKSAMIRSECDFLHMA